MVKQTNVFEKIEQFKNVLKPLTVGKTDQDIKLMLCHCKHYNLSLRKSLTTEEYALNDFLMKKGLNAKTIYENFVFIDYPQSIKNLLAERKISIKEAQSRFMAIKKLVNVRDGKDLMTEIKSVIRRLEWSGLNKTITTQEI
ncbi:hypothetical protein HZA97_07910 [Candidatus Woesearchaeota archaeon]|nr:hypothetical protein [Candidatus Woesearchaeota archaeon]